MTLQDNARRLRREMTEVEARLWYQLRDRRLDGFKFRRQKPIGPYIVDFVCLDRRLIIELDGGHHALQVEADARRGAFLLAAGFRVLRFWNHEVLAHEVAVLERIHQALLASPHADA